MNGESNLFDEAFWVMLLGMGIVFAFLGLLILMMYASQWLFARFGASPPPASPPPESSGDHDPLLLAAVAAAVRRYRSEN